MRLQITVFGLTKWAQDEGFTSGEHSYMIFSETIPEAINMIDQYLDTFVVFKGAKIELLSPTWGAK